MKKALITGVTGQDGAYLSKYLLSLGYQVHGIKRRSSLINTSRIDDIYEEPEDSRNFILHYGDLTDSNNILRLINEIEPDEIYNLAAQSHVQVSFETAEYTANSDAFGVLRFLEAIRNLDMVNDVKFYQASTSELYGKVQEIPQSEKTPFYPRSPYGVAKLYGYWITINYRESYGMHASNGILFNHESPLRGETFVTQKIILGLVDIFLGKKNSIRLGNLGAQRDWGHARDFVKGMHKIVQQKHPSDYVLATGRLESVKSFIEIALDYFGEKVAWEGSGIDEVGILESSNKKIIQVDERYFRPAEVELLVGDYTKAKKELGWEPETKLEQLIKEMLESAIISKGGSTDLLKNV
tara:strand:+ start:2878 stop:3936 length:1059 start_codon:yes stop_codon:yes gene_type:complete